MYDAELLYEYSFFWKRRAFLPWVWKNKNAYKRDFDLVDKEPFFYICFKDSLN